MHVTVIGRGKLGGGLARLWREAGHDVDELGRDGGDAGGAHIR
jgi:predicted dinucleotide-binding enzyme